MKNTFMTSFQKEQYTQYLQTQLQKFSAFMLGQRKENQRYKIIEQACQNQNQIIDQMRSRMQLMQICQRQNTNNCEKLFKKHQNWENIDGRVRRLQDRERFDCDHELKKRAVHTSSFANQKEKDMMKIQAACSELGKKIKRIEQQLMRNKEMSFGANQGKLYFQQEKDGQYNGRFVERIELKKLQKKIKKYLIKKIGNADEVVFQKHKSRSKSPSYKTPMEGVNKSQDESLYSQRVLSEFRFDESNLTKGKSDISTVSRLSKNMDQQSRKKISEFRKKKSKHIHSKSKSKGKENKKNISRSKSKSKSKLNNKSITLSQKSYLSSQLSRSKSNTSKLNKSLSKKSKKLKKARPDVSVSKSYHSSISHTHDKCKKRPEETNNKKQSKARPKKQVSPLSKGKGRKML